MKNKLKYAAFSAGTAAALEHETVVFKDLVIKNSAEGVLGKLTVKTGWDKISTGPDQTINFQIEMIAVGSQDFPEFHSTDSFWALGMSKDLIAEKAEYYRFNMRETSVGLVQTMGYGSAKINVSLIDDGVAANSGSAIATNQYQYIMSANAPPTTSPQQVVLPGFWKVDQNSRLNNETRTLDLVLTTNTSGFAEVKTGGSVKASFWLRQKGASTSADIVWRAKGNLKWAAESTSTVDTTPNTVWTEDDPVEKSASVQAPAAADGSTAVVTFGISLIGAICTLMF